MQLCFAEQLELTRAYSMGGSGIECSLPSLDWIAAFEMSMNFFLLLIQISTISAMQQRNLTVSAGATPARTSFPGFITRERWTSDQATKVRGRPRRFRKRARMIQLQIVSNWLSKTYCISELRATVVFPVDPVHTNFSKA